MTSFQLGRVVLWMTGALLSFCALAISVRVLTNVLTVIEALAVRGAVACGILAAVAMARPRLWSELRTRHLAAHLGRSMIHLGAQYLWALAIIVLPLATVFALEFTIPIWICVLAPFFLGERMTVHRAIAVGLGFAGVLIILRPASGFVQPAALLVLAAALGYAIFNLMTKRLTGVETTFAIVFWMNILQFPVTLVFSDPARFLALGWAQMPAALAIGISGLSAHFCIAQAFRYGDASVVMPFDFLRIPLIAVIGWFFYGEPLDPLTFVGAAVIVSGVAWNLRMESKSSAAR